MTRRSEKYLVHVFSLTVSLKLVVLLFSDIIYSTPSSENSDTHRLY